MIYCLYIIIAIVGLIFLYRLYGIIFLHRLTDEEIIELVGFQWKRTLQIKKEILKTYSNKWGGPRPSVNTGYIYITLARLKDEGLLEERFLPPAEEEEYNRLEYRRTRATH